MYTVNFNEQSTLDSREAVVVREKNSYHHGDLRRALIDEGLTITRAHGPRGLGLRAVTREVGVSANAAYRHFTDQQALLAAVAAEILEKMAAHMRELIADLPPDSPQRSRLRAVGLGYIEFAVSEPGWFDTAFFGPEQYGPAPEDRSSAQHEADRIRVLENPSDGVEGATSAAADVSSDGTGGAGSTDQGQATAPPFALLVDALDHMVAAGELRPDRRAGAEWSCWSAVHGFAGLVVHGPLRQLGPAEAMSLAARVVDDIIAGIL
ncbi:TetR/AcrR family transcriptional regulator [Brevibacterium celere]|uniref:TetR/AcrR family transcriptional regulator n=1 Tax=Brevibacterium celere TaxID=225845 RepID=UPI001FE259A6|nr:TetR/AcrR family transcriptional regulator [Brevibacterium celere]